MSLMSATLYSLAHTGIRLIDAQQSQFAADASALGCILVEKNLAQEKVERIAEQNLAKILELEASVDKCTAVVGVDHVVRRAVAVSVRGLDLPTLQR